MDGLDPSTRKLIATALAALDAAIERMRGRSNVEALETILGLLQERVTTLREEAARIRDETETLESMLPDDHD